VAPSSSRSLEQRRDSRDLRPRHVFAQVLYPSPPLRRTPRRALILIALAAVVLWPDATSALTYYVRQTVGNDSSDGTSPNTAWQHITKLGTAMHAGDVAYIGPGLYREQIIVMNDGAPDKRITFIADSTGEHTGDPAGIVMIVGSDPVDATIFVPGKTPGTYSTPFPSIVLGVVEMDGNQFRYRRVNTAKEYHVDKMDPVDIVAKLRSSFHYDEPTKMLYIHTSDDRAPTSHELELQRRDDGIGMIGKHYVTVTGFVFRHQGDAGISFFVGSSDGVAVYNTAWGSRQGIRVYGANNILAYGNTIFRNENCGIYFAKESLNGSAIHNTAYDNLLAGVRWSSGSRDGLAADNIVFDNLDRGILIEQTEHIVLSANEIVNNKNSQILVRDSSYSSDLNCFQIGSDEPNQLIAEYWYVDRYRALRPYQDEKHLDLDSREGNCAPLPAKLDVHKLDAGAAAYAERARQILSGAREGEGKKTGRPDSPAPTRSWLDWLRGR